MGQTPELARVTTEDITPEISQTVDDIITYLEQEVSGPPMALSILTIAMVAIHNKYGHVTQEEFAEKMKINLMNTKVGIPQGEKN